MPGDGAHRIIAVHRVFLDGDRKDVLHTVFFQGLLHCTAKHTGHHILFGYRRLDRAQDRAEQYRCQGHCQNAYNDQQHGLLFAAAGLIVIIVPAAFPLMGGRRFVLLLHSGGGAMGRSYPDGTGGLVLFLRTQVR